jgi:hypothetical protein
MDMDSNEKREGSKNSDELVNIFIVKSLFRIKI